MAKTSAGSCKKRKGVIGCLVVFGFVRLQKPSSSSTRMTSTGCEFGHLSSVRNTLHILCSLTQTVQLPMNHCRLTHMESVGLIAFHSKDITFFKRLPM